MSNTYQRYATDPVAIQNGTPVLFSDDMTITIRGMRSDAVRAMQDRINKRNQQYYRSGSALPTKVQDADQIDIAVAIINGWKGVTGPDGAALEYTADAARQLVTELPELREQIIAAASMAETFRVAALRATTENLSSASASNSNSAAAGAQA